MMLNLFLLLDYIWYFVMSAISDSFKNHKADSIVEQELKELESRATENYEETINHTLDNIVYVDAIRAKGF